MKYALIGNIGLANEENSKDEVKSEIKRRVFDTIVKVTNEYGQVTDLELQETGGGDFEFYPYFNRATAISDHVTTGSQGRGRRGVASFSTDNEAFQVQPLDDHNELVGVVTHDIKRGKKVKIGKITIYRNIHKDHKRSTAETIGAVRKMIKKMRTDYDVKQVIVWGDWNEEKNIYLGANFRELTHPDLKHKHNDSTRETRIDRVFANFRDAEILEVYPTFENKVTGQTENLGHKAYLVRIGEKSQKEREEEESKVEKIVISLNKLKQVLKGHDPDFSVNLLGKNEKEEDLESAAVEFSEEVTSIIEKAKVSIKGKKRKDHIMLNQIIAGKDQIKHGRKQDKVFFELGKTLTKGLTNETSKETPPIEDLHGKLKKKLDTLNETDIELGTQVIEELYSDSSKLNGSRCKTLNDFKKVVMSTSKSGAVDYMGMTLKATRTVLGSNNRFLRRYKEITDGCMKIGYFPWVWKEDSIHFIYKQKGKRSDAANWRPITIAPSLGKHLEKIIAFFISPIDDKNPDNFAYVKKKSCLSAITKVNEILSKARRKFKKCSKYDFISFLSLDDISGAFESIDHVLVRLVFEKLLILEEVNIGGIIGSYFKRRVYVVENEKKMELKGKFENKTSPQGSLLSPTFWRIYDAIFTRLYRNNLEDMFESFEDVVLIEHVAYADDHLTVVVIRILKEKEEDEIAREERVTITIARYLIMVRDLLSDATRQIGSAINPTKSENVVIETLEERVEEVLNIQGKNSPDKPTSATFRWLGYYLTLKDGHKLVFNVPKIEAKIKSIEYMRDRIYQYTTNRELKLKIYKVYIAPYIELYLPLVIQTKIEKKTVVHDLQHRTLCRAMNIPITVKRECLESKLNERGVEVKAKRMAKRMINELNLEKPNQTTERMSTRARVGGAAPVSAADINDYLDRLFIYAEREELVEKKEKLKLNFISLRKWCKEISGIIKKKVQANMAKNK